MGEDLVRHLRGSGLAIAVVTIPVLAFLAAIMTASIYMDTPLAEFTRDPAYTTGAHPLLGIASNLGVLMWAAAASICALTVSVLPRSRTDRGFFLFASLFTTVLLLDDFFMIHDWFLIYEIGIDEKLLFALYGFLLAAFLGRHHAVIWRHDGPLMALALVSFATSLAVDAIPPETIPVQHLYEDGAKLLGIASWLAYFARRAWRALSSAA